MEVSRGFVCVRRRMVTVNVLPTPTVLRAVIVPPISSTMFLAMVSPSPVPWIPLNVVFCSRSKGSNICSRNSLCIPMPVSSTTNWYTEQSLGSCSSSETVMLILPPFRVYFTALLARYMRNCFILA